MTSVTLTQEPLHLRKPSFLQRYGLYIALTVAWVAMSGSYYMSEVLDWTPCWWCWMQRIAMYPNALILALGLILKDRKLPALSLGLAGVGIPMSIWHILIQKVPAFTKLETCKPGESCSVDYLIRVGIPFVTIPMLALTAFVIIAVLCLIALRHPEAAALEHGDEDAPRPLFSPAILVPLIVVPIAALFLISGYITKSNARGGLGGASSIANVTDGAQLYSYACASCHSVNAKLIRKEFLANGDLDLISFIAKGRAAGDADNLSGLPMPPNGGRPELTPQQIAAILKYMREIKQ
jgi:disulfide bond formation protein DsbB/mono/diheme cytochrome c family protein